MTTEFTFSTFEVIDIILHLLTLVIVASLFINFHKKFKKIFDSPDAHEEPMPGDWNTKLNSFQKMIVLKAIRPDKITEAIKNYITEKVGKKYIEPPTMKLDACFRDSSNT